MNAFLYVVWPRDMDYLHENFDEAWKGKALHPFTRRRDCAQPVQSRFKKTVWVVQRRVPHQSRVIANMSALKSLLSSIFGPGWSIVEFDSPNEPCGSGHNECLGFFNCKYPNLDVSNNCSHSRDILFDVQLFSQVNFVVSVHGATLMNAMFLPRGAHIVEIFPAGIDEYIYHEFSKRAELEYFGFREPNQTKLHELFPSTPSYECFRNSECRHKMREQKVTVSIDKIRPTLQAAHDSMLSRCTHVDADAVHKRAHEPRWMNI
jgi:hypothetical protein